MCDTGTSLSLIILTNPIKNEKRPDNPVIIMEIVNLRLLKNVSPPFSPRLTKRKNNPISIKKRDINTTDNLPR